MTQHHSEDRELKDELGRVNPPPGFPADRVWQGVLRARDTGRRKSAALRRAWRTAVPLATAAAIALVVWRRPETVVPAIALSAPEIALVELETAVRARTAGATPDDIEQLDSDLALVDGVIAELRSYPATTSEQEELVRREIAYAQNRKTRVLLGFLEMIQGES